LKNEIHSMRKNYSKSELLEEKIPLNPFHLFEEWFLEAKKSKILEANAMCFSTSNKKGFVSSRILLLKEFSQDGFIFFTNYDSRKGNDLKENPNSSILFFWDILERQIRIEGKVYKISRKKTVDYFYSRPLDSQIGAIISNQSQILNSRNELEENFKKYKLNLDIQKNLVPKNWGGYILKPNYFEFWQGRPNRLHDRIGFKKSKSSWKLNRLYP
jgi:pyridoxamine 5'-phosphate oxidase